MKNSKMYGNYAGLTAVAVVWAWLGGPFSAGAQGTAFTYQGQLSSSGGPATGGYDFEFALYTASSGGSQAGGTVTNLAVEVTNGLFTTLVDFGPKRFAGTNYWLAVGVRTNNPAQPAGFTGLTPLQPISPVPYAMFAASASNVSGTISGTQISGPVASGNLAGTYTSAVTLNNAGNSFSGSGANLTALNAGNLTSGTLPDARLSANVALLNANQTFSGLSTFSGPNEGLIVNSGPISTNLFTGLGFEYNSGSGEGALLSSFNDGNSSLTFYTKQGAGYPLAKQVKIDRYGVLMIDQQANNNGVLNDGTTNGVGLTFGPGSGEGIASDRNSGVNLDGLDFYTSNSQRLSILHNGKVGIGLTNPATVLQVNGTVTATALVGDGSGLTNLNAGQLASGTIALGQLPSSVALLNANQTFSGLSTFSGPNEGLIVNSGPISTNLFTGLGFEYNSGSGEGALLSSFNDGNSSLAFYTKQGAGYPLAKQVKIDRYGGVAIDLQANNNGVLNDGTTNGVGLTFGPSSGEGIASDRNSGVNLDGLDFYTSNSRRLVILNNGKVGIGLTNPASALQVNGTVTATAFSGDGSGITNLNAAKLGNGTIPLAQLPAAVVTNNEPGVSLGSLTLTGGLELPIPASISAGSFPFLYLDANNDTYLGIDSGDFNPGSNDTGIGDNALGGFASGSQNTALGNGALYFVSGSDNTAVGNNALESSSGAGNTAVGYDAFNNSNPEITLSGSDNIGIGNNAGQNVTTGNNNIEIGNVGNSTDNGAIRIGTPGVQNVTYLAGFVVCPALQSGLLVCTGGVTAVTITTSGSTTTGSLTITGGSDLAEPFAISTTEQPVAEGSVVVIDEANPGQLKLTDRPYDTRVAGVVSGANGIHPGIQMHQQGLLEGGRNVALTGRVYVQADTTNGAIQPGDLLTTSSTPGRAMRVSDHARAQGAILGKAMTGLSAGQGMVLVLVTLQ